MGRSIAFAALMVTGLFLGMGLLGAEEGKTRLELKDGDKYTGEVVKETATHLFLKTKYGTQEIPKADIAKDSRAAKVPEPSKKPEEKKAKPIPPRATLDKDVIKSVTAALKKTEQAVNSGDAGALTGQLTGSVPVAQGMDLAQLRKRLGVKGVVLAFVHGRREKQGLRVTVNVTETREQGESTIRGEDFTFSGEGDLKLVISEADVALSAKIDQLARTEAAALENLKKIHEAQLAFQKAKTVDQDGDGSGEFGYLQELAGAALRVAKKGAAARQPAGALLPAEFGKSFEVQVGKRTTKHDYATVGDYCFRVYLPGDKAAQGEMAPLPSWVDVLADQAEKHYLCYAWPTRAGITGQRAFAMDASGKVWFTLGGLYGGGTIPPAEAAFSKDSQAAANLLGSLGGTPTQDGQVWAAVGAPFERPMPPGQARVNLVHRLLWADKIFPDGPVARPAPAKAPETPRALSEADRIKVRQAREEVGHMLTALDAYYGAQNRRYPPDGSTNLVIHLDGDPRNGGPSQTFFPFDAKRVKDNVYMDPWGNAYRYKGPKDPAGKPMVWSCGPNGKDDEGAGDDISKE